MRALPNRADPYVHPHNLKAHLVGCYRRRYLTAYERIQTALCGNFAASIRLEPSWPRKSSMCSQTAKLGRPLFPFIRHIRSNLRYYSIEPLPVRID